MKVEYLILHHSLTKDSETVSWEAIRRFHTSYRYQGRIITQEERLKLIDAGKRVESPWKDIGYHFGIEKIKDDFTILIGRPETQPGAHCSAAGMNRKSLGICFVGNYDIEQVPDRMWELGLTLVRGLMEKWEVPIYRIKGHREYAPYKTCPGKLFDLEKFRHEL